MGWLRSIRYSLQSLFFWLPVIWRDRHWDHDFFWYILRRKLEGIQANQALGRHVGSERDVENIRRVILVIDRLAGNIAYDMAYHGDERVLGSLEDLMKPVSEWEHRDIWRRHDHEEYLIKQDTAYVFDMLRRQIRCWWS